MFGKNTRRDDTIADIYAKQQEQRMNQDNVKIEYVPILVDAAPVWGYHLETRAPESVYGRYDSKGYTLSQSEATAFVEKHYNNRASLVKLYITEDGRIAKTNHVQLVNKYNAQV